MAGDKSLVWLRLKETLPLATSLEYLRKFNGVIEWIEPNYIVRRAGGASSSVKGKKREKRESRKKEKSATPTALVAIIDTGIDAGHRDLKGKVNTELGWNFLHDNNDIADDNGHGTQVAGIIAQSTKVETQNFASLPLKALDRNGEGSIANIVQAIDYAIAHHAAVINCSFGGPASSRALLDAIKRAETAGIVVVAAAGNEGKDLSESPYFPAAYHLPNLISVAATESHEVTPGTIPWTARGSRAAESKKSVFFRSIRHKNIAREPRAVPGTFPKTVIRLAGFSNFQADTAAPGVGIRTAHPGNAYVDLTGTSAAAGFVSGAVARLKSRRGWASAQTVREALFRSAYPSHDLKEKIVSKGVLNPEGALSFFTRTAKEASFAPANNRLMTSMIKAAMQAGNGNLDTMRNSQPAAAAAYTQTGTLPPSNYDDPKPSNTANYESYLTQLARDVNDTGIAGSKPLQSSDPTAGAANVGGWSYNLGSKNYNFTLPVLGLPGRAGLGVSLGLSYNSKVWLYNPSTNTYVFNPDRGFPAPGWRVGFGLIQVKTNTAGAYINATTGKYSLIYVEPDGTRHDLALNSTTNRFESYDSSYIAFDANQQMMYFPDGTKVLYGAYSYDPNVRDFQAYPIEITDRNGNFITISYKTLSTQKVVLDYVTDTAGRRIDFNYQNNKLVSISQNRGGSVFTYVYIDYQPVTLNTYFPNGAAVDPSPINGTQVYFPSRITYPTGVHYRFTYTNYGQINAIQKWVPTISGQGSAEVIAQTSFSMNVYNPNQPIAYTDGFDWRYEWAKNWQGGVQQSYWYNYNLNGPGAHEIQDPTTRRFGVTRSGMDLSTTIYDTGHDRMKEDTATYISDSGLSYISNPRVTQAKTRAWAGVNVNIKYTNFSYLNRDGMWLVEHKSDYNGITNALYRRTSMTYTSKPAQNILGMPVETSVYAANNTLLARATNYYDDTGTFPTSTGQNIQYLKDESGAGVIQHKASYNASFNDRGNLTRVVQHSVVGGVVTASRTIKSIGYDTNGNLRAEADAAGNCKQIEYADNYSNKPGGIGQTHVQVYTTADPTGFRGGAQWNYYTGQTIKTFNLATPGSSTESQVVETLYDPLTDRPIQTNRPDGGWVKTAYWDNWMATVTSQQVDAGKVRYKFDLTDGAGRLYKKVTSHPDGTGNKYAGQITVFDKVGQSLDESNVVAFTVAVTNDWVMADGDSLRWTHLTRDDLSRLKIVTFPDTNTRQYDYTGCGCSGNSETTVTDEMGHYTITKTDFLGRLTEAREMNPLFGDTYSKAQYIYDELDRLIQINHSNGNETKVQTRTFSFDGYGRMQSENTPEGGIVNYTYTSTDLVATVANQRNITVTNSYNNRNLLTQVTYSDGTPAVTFGYDAFGARSSMTDGEGATTYSYNSYRQLQSETRTFAGLPGKSYVLTYAYNLADQVKSLNMNIAGGSFNKNVNYAYNGVGSLTGVGTNLIGSDPNATTNVISSLSFRGTSAIKSINYGNGRRLEMGYNLNREQPTSMKVSRANNPSDKIMDYAYEYYDANGKNNSRIRQITDNLDSAYTTTYTYDGYDRLIIASSTAYTRFYQYDEWGNIKNFNGLALNHATNASGAPATNRLSTDGTGFSYTYDSAGNQTNAPGYTYTYDGANRLKTVNTSAASYGYDGDGMKVRQTTGGSNLYYVRSSELGQVVMEVTSTGVYRAYVYGGEKLLAQQNYDGQLYWMHQDHRGSGYKMTDVNGVVKYRGEFDPYGQMLLSWSASGDVNLNSKRFTGYERDLASGLDYANAGLVHRFGHSSIGETHRCR